MGTPVVELALADPVNDQNFLRNGNFYSSFWTNPTGLTCPSGVWTSNADYWYARPSNVVVFTETSTAFTQPAVGSAVSVSAGGQIGTTLTAGFTQPAVNSPVSIAVGSTATFTGLAIGSRVNIAGGGDYTFTSITDSTHMVVTNTGLTGNAAPAASVPSGGNVYPVYTAWMSVGQPIWIQNGGNYTVASITGPFTCTATNLGTAGVNAAPGVTIPTLSGISPKNTAVNCLRSAAVPDAFSLFSAQLTGAGNAGTVEWGQQINGDLAATLRQNCTFSGYLYNSTGLTLSPKLEIYTCNAFNNFNTITLQATVDLQTCANALWTYCTGTLDLSTLPNVIYGIWVVVLIPSGLNSASNYVLFSRLKFQIGSVATPFTDDVSLFVQAPSVDSTMLQDGCIARPSLFLPNVVPKGAYQAQSIYNGDLSTDSVDNRVLATGAAVANLGYTPVNKTGDVNIGVLSHTVDTVVTNAFASAPAIEVQTTPGNAANAGYYPAIGFNRSGTAARTLGLATNRQFLTIDDRGVSGYLLDTITKVGTADIQDGSVTLQKLATSLVNLLIAPGTIHQFAGPNPPAGWFVCDGAAVSRTTYAALFTAIGTYWGSGDNVNTFNLPNLVNRVPIGYGAGGHFSFATYGGEETHALSVAELPSHTHPITDQQHTHTMNAHHHSYVNPIGGFGAAAGSSQYSPSGAINTGDTTSTMLPSATGITATDATGGAGAHNNMPPYAVVFYVIKY